MGLCGGEVFETHWLTKPDLVEKLIKLRNAYLRHFETDVSHNYTHTLMYLKPYKFHWMTKPALVNAFHEIRDEFMQKMMIKRRENKNGRHNRSIE